MNVTSRSGNHAAGQDTEDDSELLDQNMTPKRFTIREVFGIDTDMEVKAFGERSPCA